MLGLRVTEIATAPEAMGLYETMLETGAASGVTHIRCKDGRMLRLRYFASAVTVARLQFWISVGVVEGEPTP
jgi:hypothetical protein